MITTVLGLYNEIQKKKKMSTQKIFFLGFSARKTDNYNIKNFIISSANLNSFELKVNDIQQICNFKSAVLGNLFRQETLVSKKCCCISQKSTVYNQNH